MGAATTLIGCLPTYAMVGPLAPILLIVLRFAQGLAIGGQWGGAMLLATEIARRRISAASTAASRRPARRLASILANLAFLLVNDSVSQEDFHGVGLAHAVHPQHRADRLEPLRAAAARGNARVHATAQNARAPCDARREPARSPVLEALRLYPKEIALAAGAFMAVQVTFYILITWVIAYGTSRRRTQSAAQHDAGRRPDRRGCDGARIADLRRDFRPLRPPRHLHGRRGSARRRGDS